MKILKTAGDAFVNNRTNGAGEVKLLPEHEEDLWQAFNLIIVGDAVVASTFRKVQRESSTGSTTSDRVKLTLQIAVRTVDFDPEAGELRLSGVVMGDSKGEVCRMRAPGSGSRPSPRAAIPAPHGPLRSAHALCSGADPRGRPARLGSHLATGGIACVHGD